MYYRNIYDTSSSTEILVNNESTHWLYWYLRLTYLRLTYPLRVCERVTVSKLTFCSTTWFLQSLIVS